MRKHPDYMLKLHGGKFDRPDRLFYSIVQDHTNCMNNPGTVKELIPEFYQNDDSFLVNYLGLDLGVRQDKNRVDHVLLPPWAKNARDFLKKQQKALESDYVSKNLHHWIDLIFGYKQRGPHAVEADNVFHHLTYEGMIDLNKITDPIKKRALKVQINEFGQTPKQLFKVPHPARYSNETFSIPQTLEVDNEKEEMNAKKSTSLEETKQEFDEIIQKKVAPK